MLPSIVSSEIEDSLRRFLRLSFPMTTPGFRRDDGSTMLDDFLARRDNLLRGPYLSLGLPFREAEGDAAAHFERLSLPFTPYRHQERAFERLTGAQPRSTLVATGTGSGKTECFFFPLLDYCASRSDRGIKAIVIYPMNALASDQSRRFAAEIHSRPEIRGRVSVGLYVGDRESSPATTMQPDQVIACQQTLRDNPPDILLTNYKMLDLLLMRPRDQRLWRFNEADTLRYLVVDELHTFDGAQGTDLACLIRRLRDRLTPQRRLCCVGTSATIGGDDAEADLLNYARQVFAEEIDGEAVIREDRRSPDEFLGDAPMGHTEWPARVRNIRPEGYASAEAYLHAAAVAWFGSAHAPPLASRDPVAAMKARFALGERLLRCAAFRDLLERASGIADVGTILDDWQRIRREDRATTTAMLESLLALISAARRPTGTTDDDGVPKAAPFLSLRLQLWLREMTRMVASVAPHPALGFADDLSTARAGMHLPTAHCRECHATGWVTLKQSGESRLETETKPIYRAYFGRHPDSTLLFSGSGPVSGSAQGIDCQLCPQCGQLSAGNAGPCTACADRPQRLAVWMPDMRQTVQRGDETQQRTHHDCPFCGAHEGLSLLGSRAASLSSVMIGQLFASSYNDHRKLIAFSDSVQDAAHRAGFFGARTFATGVRMAVAQFMRERGHGMSLSDVADQVPRYWREQCADDGHFVGTFIAPNMDWLQDYEALRKTGALPTGSNLPELVAKRLSWEVMQGFGLRARVGRTLERSRAAAVGLERQQLQTTAEALGQRLREAIGPLRELQDAEVLRFLLGLLWRMRVQGAFDHPFLESYIRKGGARFELMRSHFMPNYGKVSRPPALVTLSHVSKAFDRLDKEGTSWYFGWFAKTLAGGEGVLATAEYREAMKLTVQVLTRAGLLREKTAGSDVAWALDPAQWTCTTQVAELACGGCGHRVQQPSDLRALWEGQPCLRVSCGGSYAPVQTSEQDATAYGSGTIARLTAAEHTGLLDGDTRAQVEDSFINGEQPWDVNLLSATPTLEMGIDIGDLSSVLLCSVPPAQANYQQRIGRAGRRDGNALTLTVANGDNHDLYFYADPLEMVAGDVRTPGVFLQATAVLERQLIAFSMDRWAASGIGEDAIPGTVGTVLNALEREERDRFPYNLLGFVAAHRSELLNDFLEMFQPLSEEAEAHLRDFFAGGEKAFDYRIVNRLEERLKERRSYSERIDRLKRRKDELEARPEDEGVAGELDEVLAERGALLGLRRHINGMHTLNFFTDEGLLPNYAFPEEGVTLRSVIIRRRSRAERNSESGDDAKPYEKLNFQLQRPAQSAISELAPTNRFYAVGRQVEIDQVELDKGRAIENWRLCDRCHHVENIDREGDVHSTCPKCGSAQWADSGQKRELVRLRQVYASADDRESRIGDDSDQRTPAFFHQQLLVEVPIETGGTAYRLTDERLPFGFEYLPRATMRDINFGQPGSEQEQSVIAGEAASRPGFRLCRHCGKVQGAGQRRGNAQEHAYECRLRKPGVEPREEDFVDSLYLFRELSSEAVRILLPLSEVAGSSRSLYSLIAALNLGLRRYFRGNVDHIQAAYCSEPAGGGSNRRHYVVLFDRVPGGTGYLKELLRRPENLFELMRRARDVLRDCRCAEDPERDGCYRCILAYREKRRMEDISRQVAESLLGRILEAADTLESVDKLDEIDLNTLLESELEQRFLHALAGAGPGVTLTPAVVNGKPGSFLSLTGADGTAQAQGASSAWKLEPQRKLGPADGVAVNCKPDFVLWPVRASEDALPVAVFADGFQYHYGSLADDTLKRQAVLDSGLFRVWTLGWHDMPIPGEKPQNPAQGFLERVAPGGTHQFYAGLARASAWPDQRQCRSLIAGGSFGALIAYLRAGGAAGSGLPAAAASAALGWLDARSATDSTLRQQIRDEVEKLLPPNIKRALDEAEQADRPILGGVLGALSEEAPTGLRAAAIVPEAAMRTAREGDWQALHDSLAACLAIDDSDARADKEFEARWLSFWGAANVLQFLPGFALSASSALERGSYMPLATAWWQEKTPLERGAAAAMADSAAWEEVVALSFQPRDALNALLEIGAPMPEVGFELTGSDGDVLAEADLAWLDARLAVLAEPSSEERVALEAAGWTVFDTLDDAAIKAIRTAFAGAANTEEQA